LDFNSQHHSHASFYVVTHTHTHTHIKDLQHLLMEEKQWDKLTKRPNNVQIWISVTTNVIKHAHYLMTLHCITTVQSMTFCANRGDRESCTVKHFKPSLIKAIYIYIYMKGGLSTNSTTAMTMGIRLERMALAPIR
jgi:hypothetical protein